MILGSGDLNFIYLSLINSYELSHLDSQEIKPVSPKENQPWIFTGKIDTEVEAPIVWRPDAKSQLTGKDSDVGKDWRQDEKGATEHEMVGCRHHQLNAQEFEQTLRGSEGQGSLACCNPCLQRVRENWVNEQQQMIYKPNLYFLNLWLLSKSLYFAYKLKKICTPTVSLEQVRQISEYISLLLFSRSVVPSLFCGPVDCSPPGSSVHAIPRWEHWSGLHLSIITTATGTKPNYCHHGIQSLRISYVPDTGLGAFPIDWSQLHCPCVTEE